MSSHIFLKTFLFQENKAFKVKNVVGYRYTVYIRMSAADNIPIYSYESSESDNILFFLFQENKDWHFIWIITLADELHEII